MLNKNNLKTVFTFIGTLIGAGFASGREIALFFARFNIFTAILGGIACGALAFVFMEAGRITDGAPADKLFPKTNYIWDILVRLLNFAVFCAMLAGAEETLFELSGIRGGGIISGLLAVAVVLGGIERLKLANLVLVPLIIACVVVLYAMEPSFKINGSLNVTNPILYAAMNIMSGGLIVSRTARGSSRRDSVFCAVAISVILALLIVLISLAIQNDVNQSMPLYALSKRYGLGVVGGLLIYVSILTTMFGSLSLTAKNGKYLALIALAAGFAVSVLGFALLVDTLYPIIGVFGCIYTAILAVRLVYYYLNKKRLLLLKFK